MPKPEQGRYMKSHEWVVLEGDQAQVGISDHAQSEITDVVFVDLPKVGRKVKQGEACCVVESVKAAFDIYAPVSGSVAEVNAAVTKDPSIVNQSPYEKGWLFKLSGFNKADRDKLMSHAQYQDFLKTAAH